MKKNKPTPISYEPVTFAEYDTLRRNFNRTIMLPLIETRLHPERLPFQYRLECIARLEPAYLGIFKFVTALLDEEEKGGRFSRSNHRHLRRQLPHYNFIKIKAGQYGDYIISAPPLGDRHGGNAALIAYFTKLALETTKKEGGRFRKLEDTCVIVKQYCHCKDVAMGTMENREVHSIVDTIIKANGLDDNPWWCDMCYVWCESDNPRTEIVITSRSDAEEYNDFVNALYEEKREGKKKYRETQTKHDRLLKSLKSIADVLEHHKKFESDNAQISDADTVAILSLAHDLCIVLSALRTPYISEEDHHGSRLYVKKRTTRKKKLSPEEELLDELAFQKRIWKMTYLRDEEVFAKTFTPLSLEKETGRELCEEHEIMLRERLSTLWNSEMCHTGTSDLVFIIERLFEDYDYHAPDSENLNLTFLETYAHRVKIIYAKTIKKEPPKSYDCVLRLRPKSYGFSL